MCGAVRIKIDYSEKKKFKVKLSLKNETSKTLRQSI